MKRLFTAASLAAVCISCQQQANEKPLTKEEVVLREQTITQNRKWGWFKPLDKFAPFVGNNETWHIENRGRLDDSTTTVAFQNADGNMKITTVAYNNLIFGHMLVIKDEDGISRQLTDMLTSGVPQDKQGNWLDEQNNAIISFGRQPNGKQVFYKIQYNEFYN